MVAVEHIRVRTARPFTEVVSRIEAETGLFDAAAVQARVLIGNPLTAARMTTRQIGAGLYAPLSLLIYADESGTVLEYDRPSSLFAQFHDAGVDEVARELDEKMAALVAP